MKNIIIQVPRNGASVQFALRAGASAWQAVIVASDDIEIRLAQPATAATARRKTTPTTNTGKATTSKANAHDLNGILKRLIKLKPTKRDKAVNSIKAMFQLTAPISDETANQIFEGLRKRGSVKIDADSKLQFRNA